MPYEKNNPRFAEPSKLSNRNFAIWWLGSRLYTLMLKVKFRATPDDLRYLHRDPVENDPVLLRELIHSFQSDMTHEDRQNFRKYLTTLFPPRPETE
ncbi:MAG: hypothetical protein ABSH41_00395 [Syntrophobacteraceae bacterium]|jgi:hypothetical protein